MSAAENKKLMQEIFAAIAAGDRSLFVDSLADDVAMRVTGKNSWSQTFHGKASLLRDLYGYLDTLLADGRRTVPLRFIADGDHVVIEARGEMMTRAGVAYENEYCLVYRLEGRQDRRDQGVSGFGAVRSGAGKISGVVSEACGTSRRG